MNTNRIEQSSEEEYDLVGLTALEELIVILGMSAIVSVLCVCSLLIAGVPASSIVSTISGWYAAWYGVAAEVLRAAGAAVGI